MTAPDEQALIDFLQRSGDWVAAECAPGDVERLPQSEPVATPPRIYVLFRHTEGHPRAPEDLQRAIERLLY